MFNVEIPSKELWDEAKEEFSYTKSYSFVIEHSLISLSKWETKWNKPFLNPIEKKTYEETIDYIRCMTVTPNVPPEAYEAITDENIKQINKYIEAPMTATTFSKEQNLPKSREMITSELIYYWMVALNIPFECQKWHLNRLFTLIKICNIKNSPKKKRSTKDLNEHYAKLNAERRKKHNSKG